MGNYTDILYEKQRKGVLITLNRPEAMNPIGGNTQREIHEAFDEADADPEIRAIVITGAGRAFSAGRDQSGGSREPEEGGGRRGGMAWPIGIPEGLSAAEYIDSWRHAARYNEFLHMWELGTPIIGAINGWAMGAGSWYAIFTHLTIASENAVFGQPEVRHGSQTSFMWTLLAGPKHALRYGLTGDHIDAQEALRIGIVSKVVPQDQLLEECFDIVERISHVPPETVKINLNIATLGLQMMGLRDAFLLNSQLSAPAHNLLREEYRRPLDEMRRNEGTRAYLQLRDGPFQPEPFGPRSKPREGA